MDKYKIPAEKLRKVCDTERLTFDTTEEIKTLEGIIGQERAVNAMEFGLRIKNKGYNIYMAGVNGTGRTSYAKAIATKFAEDGETPGDICYVYNFHEPDRPLVIVLDPGQGEKFVKEMENLVEEVRFEIPKVFAGEEFENERRRIREIYQKDSTELLQELDKVGKEKGFVVRQTNKGLISVPLIDGKPVDQIDESLITDEITKEIQEKIPEMQKLLDEVTRKIRTLEKEAAKALGAVEKNVAQSVIHPKVKMIVDNYPAHEKIKGYVEAVEADMVENLQVLRARPEEQQMNPFMPQMPIENLIIKYQVNLFINNANQKGAPVICETNPNYYNLFGKIEGKPSFGGVITDFTMIKAGAIHAANGGFLIIHANEILKDPFAWDALKRTFSNQKAVIENIGEQFKIMPTATIKPESIPIRVKVIIIGSLYIQQLLYQYDEDFSKLFKIRAYFDTSMERNDDNILMFTQFIRSVCEKENLKGFHKSAVGKIIEFSARLADHQKKLSTRFNETVEIVYEADAWAGIEGAELVMAKHVEKAIREKIYRSNLLEEKIQESMMNGQILIDTVDRVVGQVNGLSVYSLGDYAFGKPSKITAAVGKGRRGVINIEREAKMSGQIHDKGVLILSGYLSGKYAKEKPLSMTASLCFEQSYGGVDGDSASCAELVVILSALTEIPLRQDLAITGSMNQRGQVQPIGGVNQKIEGFYQLCKERGFNKKQGVIIPIQNVDNLMLNEDVVKDCQEGLFSIHSISHVDEAIELLTGLAAEEFHTLVLNKLASMAEKEDNEKADKDTKDTKEDE